jgi:chromosomal replication initiator protein
LARVALETVVEGGSEHFNPIVFHGPPGMGKTHLAMGLAAAWKSRSRQSQAVYVPAIDFARELADAIEEQAVGDFRTRYRQASLLAIDDVDLLCTKEGAQRELVYTIDALLESGGRVVLTSSTPPEDLTGLVPNLLGRLLSGLSVGLALPGVETRFAILSRLARSRQVAVGEAVLRLLADKLSAPVPALLGALHELELAARVDGGAITLERARQYLAQRTSSSRPTLGEIAVATARHLSLRLADLRGPSRRRAVVAARGVAMYLARTLTASSLKQIGTYFHGRDHTTVSHGCRKTERLLESDPAIRDAVRLLGEQLRPAGPPRREH